MDAIQTIQLWYTLLWNWLTDWPQTKSVKSNMLCIWIGTFWFTDYYPTELWLLLGCFSLFTSSSYGHEWFKQLDRKLLTSSLHSQRIKLQFHDLYVIRIAGQLIIFHMNCKTLQDKVAWICRLGINAQASINNVGERKEMKMIKPFHGALLT